MDVSDKLSEALAGRLALQMSVSSLEVIEEWMDTPLTRWLDSIPLPMEMPDGSSPPVMVLLGSDARRVRWSAGGAPEGFIPKLVDYLRRAGAHPGDFGQIDGAGQALEPAAVGTWIEVRPGAVETGWSFEDRMPVGRLRELLGEGDWMESVGAECVRVVRGIGAGPATELAVQVAGDDRAARQAAAVAAMERLGAPIDPAAIAPLGGDLFLAVRARGGVIDSVRLGGVRPDAGAAGAVCAALGLTMAPPIESVARAIGAGEPVLVELEREVPGNAATVHVGLLAGTIGAANVN